MKGRNVESFLHISTLEDRDTMLHRNVGNRYVTSQKSGVLGYTALRTSTLVSRNLRLIRNSNPGHAPPPAGSDVRMGVKAQWNRSPSVVSTRYHFTGFRYRMHYQQRDVCRPSVFNYFNWTPCRYSSLSMQIRHLRQLSTTSRTVCGTSAYWRCILQPNTPFRVLSAKWPSTVHSLLSNTVTKNISKIPKLCKVHTTTQFFTISPSSFPIWKHITVLHSVQTGCRAHPTSRFGGKRALSQG
jgi:hypothetical protein